VNETQTNYKQTSDENPTFVIEDPINKVYVGKNKSLVSSVSTKINFAPPCNMSKYYILHN